MTKSKFKLSFDSVKKDNKVLTSEIRAFVISANEHRKDDASTTLSPSRKERLQELLRKLYTSICDFSAYRGNPSTPDKKIIAAWETFLDPITALAGLVFHGPFLAARMILYLTHAFVRADQLPRRLPAIDASAKPIALRCNLLIMLDDALLEQLKTLWTSSRGQRETFSWVFWNYDIAKTHKCDNCCPKKLEWNPANMISSMDWSAWNARKDEERFIAACITAPEDLTPANGVHPIRTWKRPEGDTTHHPQDLEATSFMYQQNDSDPDGPKLLIWQRIGSEGPIREDCWYEIVDQDTGKSTGRNRPALRRSRQFILDTQKIRILRERRALGTRALAKGKMPAELVSQVWKYAEPVPEEPYLDHLDLVAVYQPFPTTVVGVAPASSSSSTQGGGKAPPTRCDECANRRSASSTAARIKTAKRTCPHKAIVFWNFPLRTFHTLHPRGGDGTTPDRWALCKYVPCTGHHADDGWEIPPWNNQALKAHLVQILRAQTGDADMTLQRAGLGPHEPLEMPTEKEDNARKRRLWDYVHSDTKRNDAVNEAQWIGIDGLLNVMLENRTLLGKHPSGSTTTDPSWMFGRTRQDEARIRSTFKKE